MASLEKRNGKYRIVFRIGREKFSRSLQTDRESAARLLLARAEENLRNLELGLLTINSGDDVASIILSTGEVKQKPVLRKTPTVASILDGYLASIPAGSLEEKSISMLATHVRNLKRLLNTKLSTDAVSLQTLQGFINKRAKEPGRRGAAISPVTIRKELTTLHAAWDWALESKLITSRLPRKTRLRYPKSDEKPPFKTWDEIKRLIASRELSSDEQRKHWETLYLDTEQLAELVSDVAYAKQLMVPMVAFAAYTGARRSELLRSEIQDVDLVASRTRVSKQDCLDG